MESYEQLEASRALEQPAPVPPAGIEAQNRRGIRKGPFRMGLTSPLLCWMFLLLGASQSHAQTSAPPLKVAVLDGCGYQGIETLLNGNVWVPIQAQSYSFNVTLETLLSYDVVLASTNCKTNMQDDGDLLAAVAATGRGVVETPFSQQKSISLEGLWRSTPYSAVESLNDAIYTPGSLGSLGDAGHPILQGVSSLSVSKYRTGNAQLLDGATPLAWYSDGQLLAAARTHSTGRVAWIGLYPNGTTQGASYSGDWLRLLVNALAWTGLRDLSLSAGPFTVEEGGSLTLDVTCSGVACASYAWDLDCDAITDYSDSTQSTPVFSAVGKDGPSTCPIRVRACASTRACAETTIPLSVVNVAPTIMSVPSSSASSGTQYSYAPVALDPAGAADPLTWKLTQGPPGMSLSGSSVVSWTPTCSTLGTHTVALSVSDGDGCSVAQVYSLVATSPDSDGDGIGACTDNCPSIANASQLNSDADASGDACDSDDDADSVPDLADSCPLVPNPSQQNSDDDLLGDACDPDDDEDSIPDTLDACPLAFDPSQLDTDLDGLGDACDSDDDNDGYSDTQDTCPTLTGADQTDLDQDGLGGSCDPDDDNDALPDSLDNCPISSNADQSDLDLDGLGDVCDPDDDGDLFVDVIDLCPDTWDPAQTDGDQDGLGDACDTDQDNDWVSDDLDNCPLHANAEQSDLDADALGDPCDADDDNDQVLDALDNCPVQSNETQEDLDADLQGDVCDADRDGDSVNNVQDSCPDLANPDQTDTDQDLQGNACDSDDDNDLLLDTSDNCQQVFNPAQDDQDADGTGDACDNDREGDQVPNAHDNCPDTVNPDQQDQDLDGTGDACEADSDQDGVPDELDSCPAFSNPLQTDLDLDGQGDVCDPDADDDGTSAETDCNDLEPSIQQTLDAYSDPDADGWGDVSEPTALCAAELPDGYASAPGDSCPGVSNPDQQDTDLDGQGDACDLDDDGDGIPDSSDNCPYLINPDQADTDGNGQGNLCSDDQDGDGLTDKEDSCPTLFNPLQEDLDEDFLGDVCDPDADGDGVAAAEDCDDRNPAGTRLASYYPDPDLDGWGNPTKGAVVCLDVPPEGFAARAPDNCPETPNPDQADQDGDGQGDVCTPLLTTPAPGVQDDEALPAASCLCTQSRGVPERPQRAPLLLFLLVAFRTRARVRA